MEKVTDLQKAPLFPVFSRDGLTEDWAKWMIAGEGDGSLSVKWLDQPRLSAENLSGEANLIRLYQQRDEFRLATLPQLAENSQHSVFYQIDLKALASDFARGRLALPPPLPDSADPVTRFRDFMFRSEVTRRRGDDGRPDERRAFEELRASLVRSVSLQAQPRLDVR